MTRLARMKRSGEATATQSAMRPPGMRKGRGVCGSARRSCTKARRKSDMFTCEGVREGA